MRTVSLFLFIAVCFINGLHGEQIYGKRGPFFIVKGVIPLEGVVLKNGVERGRYRVVTKTHSESLCRIVVGNMDFDKILLPGCETPVKSIKPVQKKLITIRNIKFRNIEKRIWVSTIPVSLKEISFTSISVLKNFLQNRDGYCFDLLPVRMFDKLNGLYNYSKSEMLISKSRGDLCLVYRDGGVWMSSPLSESSLLKFRDKLSFFIMAQKTEG